MNKRCPSIDLLKFYSAVLICFCHIIQLFSLKNLISAAVIPIFVELFFFISGFFMMKHLDKANTQDETTWEYLFHKFKIIFAPLCIVNAVHFLLYCSIYNIDTIQSVFKTLWHFKWEFLLLHCAGMIQNPQFNIDYLVGPTWFLSAMFLALIFAYPLAKFYRRLFINIICPLTILFVYSHIVQKYNTINIGNGFSFFIMDAIMRGFAGICAGTLCFETYAYFTKTSFDNLLSFKIIDAVCWLMIPLSLIFILLSYNDSSIFFLIPFFIIIVSSMRGISPIPKKLNTINKNLSSFLGKFSLYLYITHYTAILFTKHIMGSFNLLTQVTISVILSFIYSLALYQLDIKRKSIYPIALLCSTAILLSFLRAALI